MKKHNFSAGPCILPQEVMQKAAAAVLDYDNGLSLIEISHRSKAFVDIMENARALVLEHLQLEGKGYKVLFLQGGASTQFLMVALNLLEKRAGYLNTGTWSKKAIKEASMNISMNGNNSAEVAELLSMLKNAGMPNAAPVSSMMDEPPMDKHDDMVSKIKMYDFKWKSDESRSYGVMAHELQEVLPDAVSGEKDAEEMQGVDYSKIVPLLVKSIQELKAEIELLKNK